MSWIARIPIDGRDPDLLMSALWDAGTNGVAEVGDELLAGFAERAGADAAVQTHGGDVQAVDPSTWAQQDTASIRAADRELTLEVGTAFGHGGHPTTALVLDALASEAARSPLGSMLDVGCGTGVLALAAAAHGAAQVVGVDIDADAVEIARRNADRNGFDSEGVAFSSAPLADATHGIAFDLVVANILLAEIRPLADDIASAVTDRLILSGSLVEQRGELLALFPNLHPVGENHADGWLCLILSS